MNTLSSEFCPQELKTAPTWAGHAEIVGLACLQATIFLELGYLEAHVHLLLVRTKAHGSAGFKLRIAVRALMTVLTLVVQTLQPQGPQSNLDLVNAG